MNRLIARLAIFSISLYFIATMIFAWSGIDITNSIYILILEYCFFILIKTQKQYHCSFARYLALNIFLTDAFTYIDSIFNIVPDTTIFLIIISSSWAIAVLVTIILAIKHFIKVIKLKRQKQKWHEREQP